jgi:hypothetical protein
MLVQRTLMPLFRNGSRYWTDLLPLNSMAAPETKTRQAMNIYNNEDSSCNHRCSGKAISITYVKCGFVALVIQHAMRMCHVICGLSGSTIFLHYFIIGRILEKSY